MHTEIAYLALDSGKIQEYALANVVPLLLLVIGIGVIAGSKKMKARDGGNTLLWVVIGVFIIVAGTVFRSFADQMVGLLS